MAAGVAMATAAGVQATDSGGGAGADGRRAGRRAGRVAGLPSTHDPVKKKSTERRVCENTLDLPRRAEFN